MRRWAFLGTAAVIALAVAGCGGDDEKTAPGSTSGTSAATSPAPGASSTATTPPPAGGGEHQRETDTAAGGEQRVRIPASFTLRGGRLSPGTVTVPPFLAIEVSVRSRETGSRLVTVRADRAYRLPVGPGARVTRLLPGQRAGTYAVEVSGGGRATLVVGGEPGP